MKIQCACGAKYAFDITPEMADQPVRFVCPNCGLDASDFVNNLVRQELGLAAPADAPPPAGPVSVATPRLQVAPVAQPAGQTAEPAAGSEGPQYCFRHRGELCTERCVVCQKPICPKCMELFGYVCSPLCKARAEAKKIKVPVYAGQKSVVEAQFWQKTGRISGTIAAAVAALLGFWFWYAWFGSVPHPVFSVRFTEVAHSGQSRLCGKNQLVFLHGGTLARYDLRSKKEIWSRQLIDVQQIKDAVAREEEAFQAAEARARGEVPARTTPVLDEKEVQLAVRGAEEELRLQVAGSNVWVGAPGKLTHYDWDSGKVLQEIPLAGGGGEMVSQGGELLMMGESETGQPLITHLNLANGESRTEEIGQPGQSAVAAARNAPGRTVVASAGGAGSSPAAGLPLVPGAEAGKPLNPGKVAEQAQSLPLPARIALPALLANSMHQERIMQEANDTPDNARAQPPPGARGARSTNNVSLTDHFSLIPSKYGNLQFAVRLLEEKIVTREAMKAPPARSALDSGNLNATRTADVANEILNEMQRNRGGNTVQEDESRYQVAIRRPDSTADADWTGEVVGPPALFPLKTVNVLTAGKTVIVFDKTNKKLWQATLAYSVLADAGAFGGENTQYGEGPCVERSDTLFVFDQAVLTAFDAATGNVRWRLPSVGIVGLFFDDRGMLYVNSTTASPENIKYSRQIDINQQVDTVFLKVEPKTGRILWSAKPGCFISYLSGKFIYAVRSSGGGEEEDVGAALAGITPGSPLLRIRRISPKDGRILWDYQQLRAPLDVQFNGNTINLVFKKEVQVLKFVSF